MRNDAPGPDRKSEDGDGATRFASDGGPYPLAWDQNGERFDVPSNADCWRIKRSIRRGPAEILYDRVTGTPLRIALNATIDDLARVVGYQPGRYRLELLDRRGRAIKDTPTAVVEISGGLDPSGNVIAIPAAPSVATTALADALPPLLHVIPRLVAWLREIAPHSTAGAPIYANDMLDEREAVSAAGSDA
jgi:hypothetical protein